MASAYHYLQHIPNAQGWLNLSRQGDYVTMRYFIPADKPTVRKALTVATRWHIVKKLSD